MSKALFLYADAPAAQRAARRVIAKLPSGSVVVHANQGEELQRLPEAADEAFSGGLLGNMYDLFRRAFENSASLQEPDEFDETVRRGGAVVSVDATTTDQQDAANALLSDTGFIRRTPWRAYD